MRPPVRRLLVSMLLTLAVAGAGVTAAGAVGHDASGTPLLPAVFVGDEGVYESEGNELRFRFAQEDWVAANGRIMRTLTLDQERNDTLKPGWVGWDETKIWLDDGHVAAGKTLVRSGGGSEYLRFGGPEDMTGRSTRYDLYETRYDDTLDPFCGLVHSLQGRAVATDAAVVSPGCPAAFSFIAATLESGKGIDQGEGSWTVANDQGRLVLDARFPVPTRIEVEGRVWDLGAFHRGTAPPTPLDLGASFPVEYASGALPDETGVVHPFPLSAAVEFATDPLNQNPLGEFLRSHPGAYLADARSVEIVEDGKRSYEWNLTASDGRDAIAVTLTRSGAQVDDPPIDSPVSPGVVLPTAPAIVSEEVPAEARRYPEGVAVEPRFATLASLEQRWRASVPVNASLAGINAWGFSVRCGATCAEATTQTWVGFERTRQPQSVVYAYPFDPVSTLCTADCEMYRVLMRDSLAVDGAGTTVLLAHSDWSYWQGSRITGNPVLDLTDQGQEASTPMLASTAGDWAFPSVPEAAGLTLLGVLAGLLYYLWPALKSFAVGIFRSSPPPAEPDARITVRLAVEGSPGIHFQELRRRTGQASGGLRHHLRVLVEQGAIVAHDNGGYRCFFPARGTDRHLMASAGALKAPTARRMLHGIVEAGCLSMGDAAATAGVTAGAATHHALRLEEAGLVTRSRVGRTIELRPTPLAAQALDAAGAA